jgi:hypothetical protein
VTDTQVGENISLFHGTCSCRLPSIAKNGLWPLTCFAREARMAHAFARHTVALKGSPPDHCPCVLRWECADPERLLPDIAAVEADPEELFWTLDADCDPADEEWGRPYADTVRGIIGGRSIEALRDDLDSLQGREVTGLESLEAVGLAIWPEPIPGEELALEEECA